MAIDQKQFDAWLRLADRRDLAERMLESARKTWPEGVGGSSDHFMVAEARQRLDEAQKAYDDFIATM